MNDLQPPTAIVEPIAVFLCAKVIAKPDTV